MTTIGVPRNRHGAVQIAGSGDQPSPAVDEPGTGLVEMLVQVAALRALHARRAAGLARATRQHARGIRDPALETLEAALRQPDTTRVAVVHEDRRASRSGSGRWSRGRRCPSGRTWPRGEKGDQRVLGGVQRPEERRHRLRAGEQILAGAEPDRLRGEGGLRERQRDGLDRGAVGDCLALVGDDLLVTETRPKCSSTPARSSIRRLSSIAVSVSFRTCVYQSAVDR